MISDPAGTPRLYGASLPVNMTGPQVSTVLSHAHAAAVPQKASSGSLPTLVACLCCSMQPQLLMFPAEVEPPTLFS